MNIALTNTSEALPVAPAHSGGPLEAIRSRD